MICEHETDRRIHELRQVLISLLAWEIIIEDTADARLDGCLAAMHRARKVLENNQETTLQGETLCDVLKRELRCVTAERDRAQLACQQVCERLNTLETSKS